MINDKNDLREYLTADKMMLGKSKLGGVTGRYLLWLRRTEYHLNVGNRCRGRFCNSVLKLISIVSGICIPPNTFGKGLGLYHYGSIIVNPTARFGDFCGIQVGVNIAENVSGGDCVYLAPGAKVNNNINIASNVIVASNAVLVRNADTENSTYGGVPAKIISNKG
jgi:serine O-acetyltransferase